MGKYINPPDMTKEQFLEEHGTVLSQEDFLFNEFDNYEKLGAMVVAWVDNGPFTAAIICFSKREYDYVRSTILNEPRLQKIYIVKIEHLKKYLN